MKIAFTTSGHNLSDVLEPRFGRAPRFLIYDRETGVSELLDNSAGRGAAQGAGIQAAQALANREVDALITGHCGPKAFQVLQAAGITVYNTDASTIQEARQRFEAGELTSAEGADVPGHWS